MPTPYDQMVRALGSALVAATCVLVALTAANAIADLVHTTPRIGDIVAFSPSSGQPAADEVHLIVHRLDHFGCVLDLNVLRQSGGSLVVESQIAEIAGSFRVHWAGERTTAGTANCGDTADLILDAHDLNTLALSAGGYGVGNKRRFVVTTAVGT